MIVQNRVVHVLMFIMKFHIVYFVYSCVWVIYPNSLKFKLQKVFSSLVVMIKDFFHLRGIYMCCRVHAGYFIIIIIITSVSRKLLYM